MMSDTTRKGVLRRVPYRTMVTEFREYTIKKHTFTCRCCYYCGMPAACKDHAPALACVEALLQAGKISYSDVIIIPACLECNAWLGGCRHHQPTKRRDIVKKKLLKKIQGKERCDWTQDELDELGPNLRREVSSLQNYVDINRERYAFTTKLYEDV